VVGGSDNTLEGEVLGLNAALDFVELHFVNRVTFEMDASTIVTAVQNLRYT
jgi:hypothetical protein